jgi:hypothetical protein
MQLIAYVAVLLATFLLMRVIGSQRKTPSVAVG